MSDLSSATIATATKSKSNKQLRDPKEYEKSKICVDRDTAEFVPKILRIMGRKKFDPDGDDDDDNDEDNDGIPDDQEEPKKYLDYGCGSGSTTWKYLIWHAHYTNSKIYGVDICPNMIAHAKEKFSHERVEYCVGDILSDEEGGYPLKNEMFDGIVALYVLHWMEDYKKALERFYKQLKPGGKIGIMIADKLQFYESEKRLKNDEFWSNYAQEVFYPDYIDTWCSALDSYLPFMESVGYKILKTGSYPRSNAYDTLEIPLRMGIALNPFAATLSPELRDKLRKWFTKEFYTNWQMPGTIPRPAGLNEEEMVKLPINIDYDTVLIVAEKPEE